MFDMRRREFITLLGGAAAVVCSRTRPAALPTDRPICDARVPRAIGQSFDWFVPAEAEVLGAQQAVAASGTSPSASHAGRRCSGADPLRARSLESWGAQAVRHAFLCNGTPPRRLLPGIRLGLRWRRRTSRR